MNDPGKLVALVADDEPDIRELIVTILKREGFGVIEASDGEQALELARLHRPPLAVVDVQMPKLSGFEMTAALRADPATCDIKVIILTASVGDKVRDKALGAGADIYLRKPFGGRELTRRIAELLGLPPTGGA